MKFVRLIFNKHGEEFVEASIALPVAILAIMLLLRMFTFYLEILTTQVKSHRDAIQKSVSYQAAEIKSYRKADSVKFMKGGLLENDLSKKIETSTLLYNEDKIVRTGSFLAE